MHKGNRAAETVAGEAPAGAVLTRERAAPRVRARIWRGLLLGSLLVPVNALWDIHMEYIGGRGPYVSTISLFANVVCIILVVALLNLAVRRLWPAVALTRAELVIIYAMLTISTSLTGHDMAQVLLAVMSGGHWFATGENQWEQLLAGTTPGWLVVSDRAALYGYWNGASSLYQPEVLHAWLPAVLFWSAFILALIVVFLCLSVIIRPLWSDRERLTFPIVQLPLELTDPSTALFRSGLLWIGFGIAALIGFLNGLNFLYPSVPSLPLSIDLAPFIHNSPWTAIEWLPVTFNPSLIGICFLLPLDLLFSTPFFFFYWKAVYVLSQALGLSQGQWGSVSEAVFPYVNEQVIGAFMAVGVAALANGRPYLNQVWRHAWGRPSEVTEARGDVSFRAALLGLAAGIAALLGLVHYAGMSLGVAASFFTLYLVVTLSVARVRAEFGSPIHDFHRSGPDRTVALLLGTANLAPRDLGMLQQVWWFNRAYRCHPVASELEGLQMSARSATPGRTMALALLLAAVVGVVAMFWGWLHYAYRLGVAAGWGTDSYFYSNQAYSRLRDWVANPHPPDLTAFAAMSAGFVISLLLAAARARYVSWPFHPIAFAISSSYAIHLVWLPMLIAWIVKLAVLRYGGLRLYRRVLPFFFGLILGEFTLGCTWPLVGLVLGKPSYNFLGY